MSGKAPEGASASATLAVRALDGQEPVVENSSVYGRGVDGWFGGMYRLGCWGWQGG